jgi:hypothetical protein
MLRKTIIALTAVAALGAALAPTTASAGGGGWKHRPHFGWGFHGYRHIAPADCYWVKKYTPFGVKFIKVCDYY